MRKMALALAFSGGLIAMSPVEAQTVNPSTGTDPMMWINHYPSDSVLGQLGFFALPSIKAKLAALLSKNDFNTVVHVYTEDIPIAMVQGYIVISSCMPHDCGSEGDTILYSPRTGDIAVGFIDNDAGPSGQYMNNRLYGTFDYTTLPSEVFSLLFHTLPTGR